DRDGAGQDYRQAVRRDPGHAQARLCLAEYLLYVNKYEEAAEHFRQLLARDRETAPLLGLARCRHLQGQTDQAQRLLDEELAYEAGLICLRNGQKVEARRWFRKALRLDPRHEGARRGLEQLARE